MLRFFSSLLGGFAGNDPDQHDGWFREGRAVPK